MCSQSVRRDVWIAVDVLTGYSERYVDSHGCALRVL